MVLQGKNAFGLKQGIQALHEFTHWRTSPVA
jgi:hypothetical protein